MIDQLNTAKDIHNPESLAKNLQKLMRENNISEAELARKTKLPQPTVHKLLTGKTIDPRASTLKLLADYFSISIDELLSVTNNSSKEALQHLNTQSIPIISWTECLNAGSFIKSLSPSTWENWITTEPQSANAFAVTSKPSMEPRFPRGSILVIDPDITPNDGDIVVVIFQNTPEATLRQISIDGPIQELLSVSKSTQNPIQYDNSMKILGIVVKSIFSFT